MKKVSALLLAILLCLVLPVTAFAFSGGDGSPGNPFIITTAAELDAVRNHLDAHFRLGNDIDLTDYLAPGGDGYAKWGRRGWEPIGGRLRAPRWEPNQPEFSGSFDGNGHVIRNLRIFREDSEGVGLFGRSSGEIRNLGVEIASGIVVGRSDVGGLVGRQQGGSIINSYATGNVSGVGSDVGGLVGWLQGGSIENSYATGNVRGAGIASGYVGGLVGWLQDGSITNSHATGDVSGSSDEIGGLVGRQQYGTITNSYATGNVGGYRTVGGLVGWQLRGTITNSYATGDVIGGIGVGGLVGSQTGGTITNSYATGRVIGIHNVGGLAGGIHGSTITNSYAMGNVNCIDIVELMGNIGVSEWWMEGGPTGVGGLIGNWADSTITNSFRYQNATISGEVNLADEPDRRHGGIMTADQLMSQATYENNGWQFTPSAWHWDSRGFPKLNIGTEDWPFPFPYNAEPTS